MENLKDAFEQEVSALRRVRDFEDLQNEIAGRETGRAVRFLTGEARGTEVSEKRRAERAEMLTRLQMMMQDPAYAALHADAVRTLRQTTSDLDRMRDEARRLWEDDTRAIARIDARAAKDSEGRAVFRDKSGDVRYADRALVSEDEAAGIVWRGDEPRLEEREFHAERRARVEGIMAEIDAGQAEIGGMQDRLDNDDDPASADEIKGMTDYAGKLVPSIQSRLDAEQSMGMPAVDAEPETPMATVGIAIPTLPAL